jgi:DNA-directed RNA polymerase subunit RPC12/RpoP
MTDAEYMTNTIKRSARCADCGAEMLWTQNAWPAQDGTTAAAYRCANGHVLDPSKTRQCPACGLHDTVLLETESGRQSFRCNRCGQSFEFPRG